MHNDMKTENFTLIFAINNERIQICLIRLSIHSSICCCGQGVKHVAGVAKVSFALIRKGFLDFSPRERASKRRTLVTLSQVGKNQEKPLGSG